jgi:uncharacterized membrane protein YkvA (DUF1232 family)
MAITRVWTFLRRAGRNALVLGFALRDPATPLPLKLACLLLLGYLVSPFDLIPDFLLGLGWADDLVMLAFVVPWLERRLPAGPRERAAAAAERLLGRLGLGGRMG